MMRDHVLASWLNALGNTRAELFPQIARNEICLSCDENTCRVQAVQDSSKTKQG